MGSTLKSLYSRRNLRINFVFILLFAAVVYQLHRVDIMHGPARRFTWAQSDHYALALNFCNEGASFFKPTTFALDVEFPAQKALENPQGITQVDFPIFYFTVGKIMKLLGRTDPWIYRGCMLLLTFLAMFSLFRSLVDSKNLTSAIIVVAFVMFHPLYVFYQSGFHITAASFSVFIIGLSFMIRHLGGKKHKHFVLGVLFLTLASMMRFMQFIHLLAIGCAYIIFAYKTKRISKELILILSGIIIVLGYFRYNGFLASEYGSVFLREPIPPTSLKEFVVDVRRALKLYFDSIFPIVNLSFIALLILAYKKYRLLEGKNDAFFQLWVIFSLIGTSIFSIIMMWSISTHEHYAFDTWIALSCILVSFLMMRLDFSKINKETIIVVTLLFVAGSYSTGKSFHHNRFKNRHNEKAVSDTTVDFKNASSWLDNNIPKDSKTLIISYFGWNTPMIGWQRKVHRICLISEETLQRLNSETFDYVVVHRPSTNEAHYEIINQYCYHLETEGNVSIYKQR